MTNAELAQSANLLREFKKLYVYKYALSAGIIGLAIVIQKSLWHYIAPAPYIFFYPAVILASLYGDGISAIIMSALAAQYFFVEPYNTLIPEGAGAWLRLLIFVASASLIRFLTRALALATLEARKNFAALEQEKSIREAFVATLTHDLRTPLAAAKMNVEFITKGRIKGDEVIPALLLVLQSIRRLDQMLEDLLNIDKIKVGKGLPIEPTSCNLTKVVKETIYELSPISDGRINDRTQNDIVGNYDCKAIKRVVENLCANAIKYGSKETPITVTLQQEPKDVTLAVHNYGSAISPSEIDLIFEPYKRSMSAETSNQKGWGFGPDSC